MFTSHRQIWFDHWFVIKNAFSSRLIRLLFLGMALTEKQGGSDVRANKTRAFCDNYQEKRYVLIGHKYDDNRDEIFFLEISFSDGFVQHQ